MDRIASFAHLSCPAHRPRRDELFPALAAGENGDIGVALGGISAAGAVCALIGLNAICTATGRVDAAADNREI